MGDEQSNHVVPIRRVDWWRVGSWLLGLAVLSAIVLGPWGLLGYVAGFFKSGMLMLFFMLSGLAGWPALFLVASVRTVRDWRARRKRAAAAWSGLAFGIVLALVLQMTGQTPAAIQFFGRGFFRRLEIRTDFDAVQVWVESLQSADSVSQAYSNGRGRYLPKGEQPQVLRNQDGRVALESDTEGRPHVRLRWSEGRAGTWGFVIGHRDMRTPPSDPNIYGESRTELRPGIYFWYVEG